MSEEIDALVARDGYWADRPFTTTNRANKINPSLLISLWAGRKPTRRTYEMVCFYFSGWATEEELFAHIESLQKHDA